MRVFSQLLRLSIDLALVSTCVQITPGAAHTLTHGSALCDSACCMHREQAAQLSLEVCVLAVSSWQQCTPHT